MYIYLAIDFSQEVSERNYMDNLLCDEVWLTDNCKSDSLHAITGCFYTTREDCEQAFEICQQKELSYMPESGYRNHLQSSGLSLARFRVMLWLVKSQSRLNLSHQTVFNAANYFDRFLSSKQCKGWKYWMFELLAIASLSVASKIGDTAHPPFHEIQMEDLDHSFESSMIQRMELTLLKALGWRLSSITAYSYVELLMSNFVDTLNSYLIGELTTRVTELLLGTLSDSEFLEFRPCVIALSAVRCVIKDLLPSTYISHLSNITCLLPGDQKDGLIKCHKIMEGKLAYPFLRRYYCCPSSPVTVLKLDHVEGCDSMLKMPGFNINILKSSNMKRKRQDL